MMPLSLLSSVEVGEVRGPWVGEACLLPVSPSPPAGGCSVEQGDVLLLARLEGGEILCGGKTLVVAFMLKAYDENVGKQTRESTTKQHIVFKNNVL